MIIFAAPHYLLLLLLIPFFFLGMGLWLWNRRRRLRRFGDEALVNELMPSWSRNKLWVRTVLFSLAFFFFAIGLSRPQNGAKLKEHKTKGAEIMIALDVSNSMLAKDYSPNRLERAKLAISRITDKLQDDRIGLIVFAGTSFVQLPITSDYVSAKMFLNSISTESIPIQGTAIGDAINTAIRGFSAQERAQPRDHRDHRWREPPRTMRWPPPSRPPRQGSRSIQSVWDPLTDSRFRWTEDF